MGTACMRSDAIDVPDFKIVKEGYLTKKSSYFSDHLRVWFVLTRGPNPLVLIYKSMHKKKNEMFFYFSLYDIEFTEVEDFGLKFRQSKGPSRFSYSFHTANVIEYNEWVFLIRKYVNKITDDDEKYPKNSQKWTLVLEDGEEI